MTLYIDLDLNRVVSTPGYVTALASLELKRNDIISMVVKFTRDGVVIDPGSEVVYLYFAIKTHNVFSEDPALVSVGPFTKSGSGTSTQYAATVALITAGLIAKFADEIPTLAAMAEFSWTNSGDTLRASTETVECNVANDVYRAEDTVPPGSPTQAQMTYLSGVTGLTGGGATNLDGVLTVDVTVPHLYALVIGSSSQLWILQAGTNAEDVAGGVVRPDDFHATTNAKVFIRVG
jgi:hypothetical protein